MIAGDVRIVGCGGRGSRLSSGPPVLLNQWRPVWLAGRQPAALIPDPRPAALAAAAAAEHFHKARLPVRLPTNILIHI